MRTFPLLMTLVCLAVLPGCGEDDSPEPVRQRTTPAATTPTPTPVTTPSPTPTPSPGAAATPTATPTAEPGTGGAEAPGGGDEDGNVQTVRLAIRDGRLAPERVRVIAFLAIRIVADGANGLVLRQPGKAAPLAAAPGAQELDHPGLRPGTYTIDAGRLGSVEVRAEAGGG